MSTRSGSGVIGVIVSLIMIGFVIGIGLILNNETNEVMDQMDMGTEGNETRTTLQSNIGTGFRLLSMSPLIMAGAAILGILVTGFAFYYAYK